MTTSKLLSPCGIRLPSNTSTGIWVCERFRTSIPWSAVPGRSAAMPAATSPSPQPTSSTETAEDGNNSASRRSSTADRRRWTNAECTRPIGVTRSIGSLSRHSEDADEETGQYRLERQRDQGDAGHHQPHRTRIVESAKVGQTPLVDRDQEEAEAE